MTSVTGCWPPTNGSGPEPLSESALQRRGDGRDASFAGMNATITNVTGDDGLIDAVQRCWASLFSPRVILEPAGALRLVPQWPSLCN